MRIVCSSHVWFVWFEGGVRVPGITITLTLSRFPPRIIITASERRRSCMRYFSLLLFHSLEYTETRKREEMHARNPS